jgi:hypothetical protein
VRDEAADGDSAALTTSTVDTKQQPRFGSYYFEHDCGRPYRRDDHWLSFFANIADHIVERLNPQSVLDAGCAWGFLVEALRKRGVEAFGVDISEYAIANVDESVREHCQQASLVEPLPRRYDLVICMEVLEHMPPADAEIALANVCAASDRILFSSTPFDYGEPTHVNVQPPEDWSASFARHGFYRKVDFDASFLTDWAALYERSTGAFPDLVRAYDRAHWRLDQERHQLRRTVLELQNRLEQIAASQTRDDAMGEENDRLREELLTARDTVIGHEARLGEAEGEIRRLETELMRYRDRIEEIDRSRAFKAVRQLQRLRARLRGGP